MGDTEGLPEVLVRTWGIISFQILTKEEADTSRYLNDGSGSIDIFINNDDDNDSVEYR